MPKTSVVIVVPIYRAELSELECVALGRLQEVWGQYPRVFVAPASLAFDFVLWCPAAVRGARL